MSHFYAHGGHVGSNPEKRDALRHKSARQHEPIRNTPAHLRYFAEQLRRHGHGEDKILAHINPQEAMELGLHHGYDINPETGLPQFGFWDNVKKFLPAVGGVIGSILFPPLAPGLLPASIAGLGGALAGGAIGGTLGGAIANPEAPFRGTLPGLGVGAGAHLLGPMLGMGAKGAIGPMGGSAGRMAAFNALQSAAQVPGAGMLGAAANPMLATSVLSSMMGRQQGQAPQQLAPQAMQQYTGNQPQQQPGQKTGFFGSIGRNIMDNPLQSALLGTALYGSIYEGERARKHKEKTPHQIMNEMNPYGPENYRRRRYKKRRILQEGDIGYDPENRFYESVDTEPEYYAEGGYVQDRVFRGKDGGQSDKIPTKLKPNSYIMDATTVSLAGDGNTEAGFERIKKDLLSKFERGGIIKDYPHSHSHRKIDIDAKVSPGEMEIDSKYLYAAGKGNPVKGAKVFDRFRNNLRKHKGVKKFLPPKSKPLTAYMR